MMDKVNSATATVPVSPNQDPGETKASRRNKESNEGQKTAEGTEFSGELSQASESDRGRGKKISKDEDAGKLGATQAFSPERVSIRSKIAPGGEQSPAKSALTASAEKSPLTYKSAASVNTANDLAGLKPWSKEWVFEGSDDNPALKGLFSNSPNPTPDTKGIRAIGMPGAEKAAKGGKAALGEDSAKVNSDAQIRSDAHALSDQARAALSEALLVEGLLGANPGPESGAAEGIPADAGFMAAQSRSLPISGRDSRGRAEFARGANGASLAEAAGVGRSAWAPGSGMEIMQGQWEAKPNRSIRSGAPYGEVSGGDFLSMLKSSRQGASPMGEEELASEDGMGQMGDRAPTFADQAGSRGAGFRVIEGGQGQWGQEGGFQNGLRDAGLTGDRRSPLSKLSSGSNPASEAMAANLVGAEHLAGARGLQGGHTPPPVAEISGHVVQGAGAKDRLSHESLLGVATSARELNAQGGGEIRVRLKPDNLGELNMRVTTHGNQVALHIQASDEKAKLIIEQSMASLKTSLAQQNLSLGKVDVTVAHAAQQGQASDNRGDQPQYQAPGQNPYREMMGQNYGQPGSGNAGRGYEADDGFGRSGAARIGRAGALANDDISMSMGSRNYAAPGRIDLRA